ncbi:hypothetical protein V5799_027043 [Amblyomma americanum]|uniref:Uncharacterized protein n=1 Tax=Amblyomma americanum TaxID=6943 RepID=A0AAQ4DGU9_AMBAM
MVDRNFDTDPYFGGTETCIRGTETGTYPVGLSNPIVQYSPDVSLQVILTRISSPEYVKKNVFHVETVDG